MRFVLFTLQVTIILFTRGGFDALAQSSGKDGPKTVAGTEILNVYTRVTSDIAPGGYLVTVESTAGFSAGDLVLVYQAQGAQINTSDDSTYGEVLAYNNAGNYELRYVTAVNASSLTVFPAFGQNFSVSGNVQAVRVPQYTTLTVPVGSSVTALPWDGRTGGIVALSVRDTAVINGSITVDTLGFRGGYLDNSSASPPVNVPGYRMTDEAYGGEKGESIAGHASMLPNGRYGRGARRTAAAGEMPITGAEAAERTETTGPRGRGMATCRIP